MNDDKNLLGKLIALALVIGAAYGAHAIAHGGFSCSAGDGSRCLMAIPAATPAPAVDSKEAPVEKAPVEKDSEDDDATLEKKAPVEPPAPAGKSEKAK
ncbi:MAG TPA: hypothetical protein VN915_02090 [Elusimicrobiota bacterium]|nr:hypothetical protein [Elusimicrobiota bacterium]